MDSKRSKKNPALVAPGKDGVELLVDTPHLTPKLDYCTLADLDEILDPATCADLRDLHCVMLHEAFGPGYIEEFAVDPCAWVRSLREQLDAAQSHARGVRRDPRE